ncbi:MAG: phosphodiester glycosidase family protein [Clostridia bacterium]|nr:phosphodiester glycosidase family protein [Clostridia bacterium]
MINYGPSKTARDLFVVSMLETSAAKFLATWYFSPQDIDSIVKDNEVVADEGFSDPALIKINPVTTAAETDIYFPGDTDGQTGTETEKQQQTEEVTYETVAETTEGVTVPNTGDFVQGDGLEIYDVSGGTYSGKMMIVHDPSRLFVGVCGDYSQNVPGKTLVRMARSYDATAAINGGGFYDKNGTGDGGIPLGVVITGGKLVWGSLNEKYEIIGFNNDNILVVGTMTAKQALDSGIRDALSFGPVLVMNGIRSSVKGSGSGLNPRTAIGQRADGAVLLLVIDGRQPSSLGATYADLIDIMMEYGAVNAANLDGGNSTGMYYNGSLVNKGLFPRGLPTCFIVR